VQGGDFICLLESIRRKPGAHEPHVQLLKRVADLPSDIQPIVAQFAQCSLQDSITRLFDKVCCSGKWDEAAFEAIEVYYA
jgi:hypothetical protein